MDTPMGGTRRVALKLVLILSVVLAGCQTGAHDPRHYYADGFIHEDYLLKVYNDCDMYGFDFQVFMIEDRVRDAWCSGPDYVNYKAYLKGIGKTVMTHEQLMAEADNCWRIAYNSERVGMGAYIENEIMTVATVHHPAFDTMPSYIECKF